MANLMDLQAQAAEVLRAAEHDKALLNAIGELDGDVAALGGACDVIKCDNGIYVVRVDGGIVPGVPVSPLDQWTDAFQGLVDAAREDSPAPTPEAPEIPERPMAPVREDVLQSAAPKTAAVAKADAPILSPKQVTGPWSDEEVGVALALLEGGCANGEIARKLGRHAGSCNMMLAKLRKEMSEGVEAADPVVPDVPQPVAAVSDPKAPPPAKATLADVAGDRPYAERVIVSHLGAVGYTNGWDSVRDLEMVEGLAKGLNKGLVADQLGVEVGAITARWKLLNTNIGDMDHQARLVSILRERVA